MSLLLRLMITDAFHYAPFSFSRHALFLATPLTLRYYEMPLLRYALMDATLMMPPDAFR